MEKINIKQSLIIDNVAICEQGGLYCLNDLHKISGGELKHKPVEFLRLDSTQELLSELLKGGDSHLFLKTTKGRTGGTYIQSKFARLSIRLIFDCANNSPK